MPVEKIEGYTEFQRDTNKIEKQFPEAMRQSAIEFATQWVSLAQANANTGYATQAAQAFIVASDGEGATLTNTSPVFYGSEFGGQARPETMQFPPYNGKTGYWFYPARRANEDQLMTLWDKGVDLAMHQWNRHG
jgi:hypothetical protein